MDQFNSYPASALMALLETGDVTIRKLWCGPNIVYEVNGISRPTLTEAIQACCVKDRVYEPTEEGHRGTPWSPLLEFARQSEKLGNERDALRTTLDELRRDLKPTVLVRIPQPVRIRIMGRLWPEGMRPDWIKEPTGEGGK